ncbi:hypothetical protein DVB69_10425 [Sporosarcina sp. BI001-red]|uniref:hypothetical protein n=1 Tax=Sporosarcina sp. BI001-red TaxID=2282866 RepID=UPI000E2669AB|nr:hypothetical protein [Sporosarcina sp. BI001-red]REB07254.1 hypothetical protein DVB69_10425 [Sporosarcina sp. BI001-red]
MQIIHWSYTRKYQVKSVFDSFPDTVVVFRQINGYYFINTMSGLDPQLLPSRKDYVQMEYLINKELGTLSAYKNRRALQKKESS